MKLFIMGLIFSLATSNLFAASKVSFIRVFKGARQLELVSHDQKIIKTYKIMLGLNPEGHKVQEGDNKTPEGAYTLDAKNPESNFHKAFHISYPNFKDKLKARLMGVSPGGDIMLHGYPNNASEEEIRQTLANSDWTNGCIAVTNDEIDEIYEMVDVPVKIIIEP